MGEDTKYCGHCKREVSSINFTIHTVHCQRNIAICSMCNEAVPRSHYQHHLETSHKSVPCPKCSQHIEPLKIFAHEKEHCPRRMVTCEHCELELSAVEHERHKEYCEARTERCKGCTKYVQVRYLQFHYETDHKYLKPEDKEKADENGSDDESSECPICLGPVTLPLALDCGHVFCMVCVKGIANTTKNCAICRRDITRDMLMDIRFCREEDIIKNYVNKPREKKTIRSHSVPSRGTGPGGRRLVHHTTEDYDEMVSALMSSRTTTPSYRYQRPSNTHTPPSYTPYTPSVTTNSESCQDSCKDSSKDSSATESSCKDSYQDDDCCCSSSRSTAMSSSASSTTTTNAISTIASTSRTNTTSTTSTTASQRASRDSVARTATSSPYSGSQYRSSSASRALTSYSSRSSESISRTSASLASTSNSSVSTSSPSASRSSTSLATSTSPISSKSTAEQSCSTSSPTPSNTTTSSSTASVSSSTTTSSYSSSLSNGTRPRRPTSLALETNAVLATLTAQTSSSISRLGSRSKEPPKNATQEQYDRWLAFQLAKADDDLPPSEFNRQHKPTFRRSFSMPERPDHTSESSSSSDSDSDTPSSRGSSRRPPASPRSTNTSSSSSASSSSRSTPISKSSSDSNASSSSGTLSSGSALSTGARPKSSGLRKRVSFKEDAPPIRREAPVLLPCEFCNDMFPERDLMRHQTSCEHNETQLPRASRLVQLASANNSSSTSLVSTSNTNVRVTSVSSTTVTTQGSTKQSSTGPASPPPRRRQGRMPTPVCTPPRKATAPSPAVERKSTDSPTVPARKNPAPILSRKTIAQNNSQELISPPPSCPSSISPPPLSPPPTTTITIVDQPPTVVVSPSLSSGSNRPFSVSPASSTSTNNSSSSNGSLSSSSTTPSTSSSASPVPANMPHPEIAPPDTPTTDIEFDYEEDIPFSRPRKGRLLSSAIFSWRSISGGAATRRGGYARSNTAPLEDTGIDDSPQPIQPVTTSQSATQLPSQHSPDMETPSPYPEIPRSPSPLKRHSKQISPPPEDEIIKEKIKDISPPPSTVQTQEQSETVFVKNPNKYKAPPPPPMSPVQRASTPPAKSMNTVIPVHNYTRSPSPPPKQHTLTINPTEKSQVIITSQNDDFVQSDVFKSQQQEKNGLIKFDSKPMMNGFVQKEVEMRINCEFCKQVFSPEKFRCHQTVCEAALRPVSRRAATPVDQPTPEKCKSPIPARHNKGPAPPPPPAEPCKPEPSTEDVHIHKRLERSHSVKDERSSYREGYRVTRRLERASSIKESRSSSSTSHYPDRASSVHRWGSREADYGNGKDSPTSYASHGHWSGSTSNLYTALGSSGSHAWSSHLGMIRDDLRTRAATTTFNSITDNGGDSDNGGDNEVESEGQGIDRSRARYASSNSLLVEVRAALSKTSPNHFAVDTGGARYRERSSSRTRPSSMYSMGSGGWGSMFDLSSPSRTFNISDAFSTASLASKRRYIR